MRRILPAVFLAVLFHVFIFVLNPRWFRRETPARIKFPAITITMSYKKIAEPLPVKKIVKKIPQKITEKKRAKVPEKVKKPSPVKVEKKVTAPLPVKKEVIERKIETRQDDNTEEAAAAKGSVDGQKKAGEPASGKVTEAVPLYKTNPEPLYPRMAKKRGYEGTVLLNVLVNGKGLVDNIWIFKSSGYNILDNAAMDTVKDWTFVPGRRGNKTIKMWVQVPVKFELNKQ